MIAPASLFTASDDLDPVLRRIVGKKVSSLVRAGKVAAQDAQDFEHDLYVRLIASSAEFDPDRSHAYAFATVVVDRHAGKLLRDRHAQKRDPGRVQRLAGDVAGETRDLAQVELAIDVAEVVETLPAPLKVLANRLKVAGVSQIAIEDGTSRKVIYRGVWQLRDRFQDAGLDGSICTEVDNG
jgi:DNA-directed RNA polymerase specialized sigma24 family protein